MDYQKIGLALDREGNIMDRYRIGSIYESLTGDEQDEFHKMDARRTIRANRRKALFLLREVSPEVRKMMSARIMTTLDAVRGDEVDYKESVRSLGWGYRIPPVLYRPQNLLNYPSYCQTYPELAKRLEEKNARLPKELSDLIERTWGMYFGGAPFDHNVVAIGKDPDNRYGAYCDERLRVLEDPGYIPHYEEGKIITLSQGKMGKSGFNYFDDSIPFHGETPAITGYGGYLPIHPQTIQNVVGQDATVDIVEIQSYDQDWPMAQGRIKQALKSMGMKVGKVMKIHFPGHGGDDAWFAGGPDYTPSLRYQSGNTVDILEGGKNPPLIMVQNDYGKGKFHNQAMWAAQDMGFMRGRTVFKYVLAHDEIGSDGWDGGGNIGNIELNALTFYQINRDDMLKIMQNMPKDEKSQEILKSISRYMEKPKDSEGILMQGSEFDGVATELSSEVFLGDNK